MTKKEILEKQYPMSMFFVVRLYDTFDHIWMDVSSELELDEAVCLWNEKTNNGTQNTEYEHGSYYEIFPSETQMLYRLKL